MRVRPLNQRELDSGMEPCLVVPPGQSSTLHVSYEFHGLLAYMKLQSRQQHNSLRPSRQLAAARMRAA